MSNLVLEHNAVTVERNNGSGLEYGAALPALAAPEADNVGTAVAEDRLHWSEALLEDDKTFEFIVVGIGVSLMALLGIIGNILTMMVLSRPRMKSSVCCLLFNLALCDLVLLVFVLPVHGLGTFIKYFNLRDDYTSFLIPQAVPYLLPIIATAQTGSIYFTMSVSVERYIAVCWPLKSRFLCTWSRARYYSAAVYIFSFLFNIPRWFELKTNQIIHEEQHQEHHQHQEQLQQDTGRQLDIPDQMIHFEVGYTDLRVNPVYTKYFMYPTLLGFQYILPFIVLSIFNTAIYLAIKKANEKRQDLTSVQTREISFAVMLVFVVIVFLCCNILGMVLLLWESQAVEFSTRYIFLANFLLTFNSSINFLLYCAFGSNFRQQFVSMCTDYSLISSLQCKKHEELYFSSL